VINGILCRRAKRLSCGTRAIVPSLFIRPDPEILWIRYWDRNGKFHRESTHTVDWDEANRKLRERLQARDGNLLEVIRKGEALNFGDWVDSFLKSYSKPPIRAVKTHEVNMRCAAHLEAAFEGRKLVDLTADAIEQYLRDRLEQRVRVRFDGATEKRDLSNRRLCTRSFGFCGVC
jgi:hypothetical protein